MKKAIKNAVFTLLLLTLSISTAFLAYLHFFASDDQEISGEWTAALPMTERAAVSALAWLQDIEAVSVSLEEMEAYMQGLTVQVDLMLEQNGRLSGTFYGTVSQESYDICRQAAYEAFAMAFQDLTAKRLRMAGYAGSTDRDSIEALVTETLGTSTVSYLMSCGPALLPSLEELQAGYGGSGTYEAAEGILARQFDGGEAVIIREEYYIRKDANLILSGAVSAGPDSLSSDEYPVLYTLKQP